MAARLPTPERVYIYDDLPFVRAAHGDDAVLLALVDQLAALLAAEPRVRFLNVDALVDALAQTPVNAPFDRALAIGGAGLRIAALLHAKTGWFPCLAALPITREEQGEHGYSIVASAPRDPEQQLRAIADGTLALIDDTIYTGLTLAWALDRLPAGVVATTHIFALQAVAQALPPLRARCTVHAGIELVGVPERDLTVIKASHLFERGAIRRGVGGDLAFYERREWLDAWFPERGGRIVALCARLHALLDRGQSR